MCGSIGFTGKQMFDIQAGVTIPHDYFSNLDGSVYPGSIPPLSEHLFIRSETFREKFSGRTEELLRLKADVFTEHGYLFRIPPNSSMIAAIHRDKDNQRVLSILTEQATGAVAKVHHRMPATIRI